MLSKELDDMISLMELFDLDDEYPNFREKIRIIALAELLGTLDVHGEQKAKSYASPEGVVELTKLALDSINKFLAENKAGYSFTHDGRGLRCKLDNETAPPTQPTDGRLLLEQLAFRQVELNTIKDIKQFSVVANQMQKQFIGQTDIIGVVNIYTYNSIIRALIALLEEKNISFIKDYLPRFLRDTREALTRTRDFAAEEEIERAKKSSSRPTH